jgi:hypothetical protein
LWIFTFYFQFCDGVQVTQKKQAQRRLSQWLYTWYESIKKLVSVYIVGYLLEPTFLLLLFPASFLESHKAANLFCFLRPPLMNPPNVGSNLKTVAINRSADGFCTIILIVWKELGT